MPYNCGLCGNKIYDEATDHDPVSCTIPPPLSTVNQEYMLDQIGPDSLTHIADEIKYLIGPDRTADSYGITINRERLLRWEEFIRSMLGQYN